MIIYFLFLIVKLLVFLLNNICVYYFIVLFLKKNKYIVNWMVTERVFFYTGFFVPVSAWRRYLAKKYWSKKETSAREVAYAKKHSTKLSTYKGFYIPTVKPKENLATFFFEQWEKGERLLKNKLKKKRNKLFYNTKKLTKNFIYNKHFKKFQKNWKFFFIFLYYKKLLRTNSFFFWYQKKMKNKQYFFKWKYLFTSSSVSKFFFLLSSLWKKSLMKFRYSFKSLWVKRQFPWFSQKNLIWFLVNWGFNSKFFFNFFLLAKIPLYLTTLNFVFIKILLLKYLKKKIKKKIFLISKRMWMNSFFSFINKNKNFLSRNLNIFEISKYYYYLTIYNNWIKDYVIMLTVWSFLFSLIFSSNFFLKSFIYIFLRNFFKKFFFFKKISNLKKKNLKFFFSWLIGFNIFFTKFKKWKKKKIYNLKIKFRCSIKYLKKNLFSNAFFFKYFFSNNFTDKWNLKFLNYDFITTFSKIHSDFYILLHRNNILLNTPLQSFFIFLNEKLWVRRFFGTERKNFEKFFFLQKQTMQNYKNLNSLLYSSFSQQLDVNVSLNLSNLLFWYLIKKGKKLIARKVFLKFLYRFKEKYKMPALVIFAHAVLKLEPKVWLKKKRIAGWIYEIPIFISSWWSKAIAIRWLLQYAKKWQQYSIADSLSQEIWDCCLNRGSSISAWNLVHATAKRNKSYMRWF